MNVYSIDEVLESRSLTAYLGVEMDTKYRSPLPGRCDSDPSFHVFKGSNGRLIWKDFGMVGKGSVGNIISLHRLLTGCDTNQACKELMSWDGYSAKHQLSGKAKKSEKKRHASIRDKYETAGIRTKTPVTQSRYIRHTQLPVPAWVIDQLELYTDKNNNLCFPTNNGIHIKGGLLADGSLKTFAGNLGLGGFSICGVDNGYWIILEGIGDFLALIDIFPKLKTRGTFLILNSTNTIPQAIEWLHKQNVEGVSLLLDIDRAGDNETKRFQTEFPTAVDQRAKIITAGKDVKDAWNEWKKR